MYEELVKRLRDPCQYENCILCQQAADAIEKLTAFAHYVAKEAFDEYEVLSYSAFFELVCRKLYKLGIVEKDGEYWSYEPKED